MGKFMEYKGEFRPQFSNRPPRPLFSYPATSAPSRFQGYKGNQFREKSKSQSSRAMGYQEQRSMSQLSPPQ